MIQTVDAGVEVNLALPPPLLPDAPRATAPLARAAARRGDATALAWARIAPRRAVRRRRAVTALLWTEVDLANRRLYLRRASSKNKKPYTLVLTASCCD
jgi:hypothetical protein